MNPTQIAALIKQEISKQFSEISDKTYYRGEITLVSGDKADVKIEGGAEPLLNVLCMHSYSPKVGEKVLVLSIGKSGANHLIMGSLDGESPFLMAHPVGSIYLSISSTNPTGAFGGTWAAWGSGRVPVGVDTGQTEFNTKEKTGGSKTHTLTVGEMPSHNHDLPRPAYVGSETANDGSVYKPNTTTSSIYLSNSHDARFRLRNTGGDGAHNNLQPYITCYMWKRTA